MSKKIIALLIAISFTGVGFFIISNNCAEANCWSSVKGVSGGNAVWGSSSTDVFIAGNECKIQHYDGTQWTEFDCPCSEDLLSIWGSSNTDVYAGGWDGTLCHFDGLECKCIKLTNEPVGPAISSIWGSSNTDVYAGGYTIFHTTDGGVNWFPMDSTLQGRDIWGSSSTDVFAVSSGGTIQHYDGTNWSTIIYKDNKDLSYDFSTIWGFSKDDVYVAGAGSSVIIHYDGSQWSNFDYKNDVFDIWGSSNTDIFVVTEQYTPARGSYYIVIHYYYDGVAWTSTESSDFPYIEHIWGSSENDIYGVGHPDVVFHYGICLNFTLLKSLANKPSNIYLFFKIETQNESGKAGEPITGLTEKDFQIFEDDKLVSQYESNQIIIPNSAVSVLSTVLLLDMSGSILETDTLNELKKSAKLFVSRIAGDNGQEVAIYLFDGREKIKNLINFTKNVADLQNAIDSITKDKIVSDPSYDISTNLNGAVQQGLEILDAKNINLKDGQLFSGTLVTFTDGSDQAGRVSDSTVVGLVNSSKHSSFTVGLGTEVAESNLKALGKTGFVWSKSIGELEAAFTKIADDISREAKKVYILGYCTPKRSGSHNVTIKVAGYNGSLSYSFDATGFEGGCDPLDIVPPTTTTTSIPSGTTTTTVSLPRCAFSESLNNHTAINSIRELRDALLTNYAGAYLAVSYYRNAEEISSILERNSTLNEQFKTIISSHRGLIEQLLSGYGASISISDVETALMFLEELKSAASPQLQTDIDMVINGIGNRYLLNGIGVRVER